MRLLKGIRNKRISTKRAYNMLRDLPYKDLGFAKIDNHRLMRRGFPEAIYCKGKTPGQIEDILAEIYNKTEIIILTSATEKLFKRLKKTYKRLCFDSKAGMIYYPRPKPKGKRRVLIITGGTSDLPIACQASRTLELLGSPVDSLYDVGIAGLHRILDNKRKLQAADVIIVIAGMEGALASVVSGLVSKPVIAVPTSIGYGASFRGIAPLLSMLNSCSPGVGVVNIDNGFGAGYLAAMINKR